MRVLVGIILVVLAGSGHAAPRSVRFVAFGDYGRGTEVQYWTAAAMAEVCAERGCDFALMLGDNIYPSGVDGARDAQFDTKFELPLAALEVPVYVVLGNHDNGTRGGGGNNARGDFEVAYAQRGDRRSDKWRMPGRWYRFATPFDEPEPLAEFFALDSSPLAATDADPDPRWEPKAYAAQQRSWLEQALAQSHARWKIAFAHHPFRSNGYHGNAGDFHNGGRGGAATASGAPWRDLVQDTVCRQGVDLLFQGHDHDLQWLQPDPRCGKTQFVVSGAAASPYPFRRRVNPAYWEKDETLGFFWFELREDDLTGAAYTLTADVGDREHARSGLPHKGGRAKPAFEQTLPRLPPPQPAK